MAIFVPRFVRQLRDVLISSPADGEVLTYDSADAKWKNEVGGGGGAPTTADYLVGTTQAGLSAEIVVGATPGGELGGTWASPTVDAAHGGSSHAAAQAAAEATAAGALATHTADTTAVHGVADTSALALTANHPSNTIFNDHNARHENGGADEMSIAGLDGTSTDLAAHLADATDAHDASAVSVVPFGTIAATQVQAALEEIVAEAVSDLGPAVILAPASSARNVIQPTAGDVIAAIVKAHAAQSVDLMRLTNSADAVLAAFSKDGTLNLSAAAAQPGLVITRGDTEAVDIVRVVAGTRLIFDMYQWDDGGEWVTEFDLLHDTDIPATFPTLYMSNRHINLVDTAGVHVFQASVLAGVKKLGMFGATAVVQQSGSTIGDLWTALKNYGWLDAGSTAPSVYVVGGTDVALTDGGTGASTAAGARTNLGVIASLFQSGGADAIKLDDLAAPDDNTDLNVSITKHGLTPKLSNVATEYLSGTGAFSIPSGSGIPSTIVDVKGDLIAATAADTVARLAAGTNGQVLTADSAETTGLKWATAAAGVSSTDNLFLTRYVCKR